MCHPLVSGGFCKCHLDPVSWSAVEFFIFVDSEFVVSVVVSLAETGVLKSPTIMWVWLCLLVALSVFALYVLRLCCLVHTYLGSCLTSGLLLQSLCNVCLSVSNNLLCSEIFFDTNIWHYCFIKTVCMTNFFHPFIFNLPMLLYLEYLVDRI